MNPQITVIIPAYKRKKYLFYALDRILAQKDVIMEIVVFSEVMEPDEVDEVIEAYPQVKFFKTDKYKGASEKRKAGISMARGEFLYMPDDDDYLPDDHFFEKAIKIMESDSNISFVSGNVFLRYEDECNNVIKSERQVLNLSGKINGFEYLQEFSNRYKKGNKFYFISEYK